MSNKNKKPISDANLFLLACLFSVTFIVAMFAIVLLILLYVI